MERLTYAHICSSVLSARGTKPGKSLCVTDRFLRLLPGPIAGLAGKIETQLEILYSLMFHDLSTKAICIRTRHYEAFDLLPRLMRLFKMVHSKSGDAMGNHDLPFDNWIFPGNFGQPDAVAADRALMTYMDLLMNWQGKDFFLGVLGNASFVDAILDILNNGERPNFSRSGFSIRLNTNPNSYMRFLFVVNQGDLERQETANYVPLPLTDRLASVYLDFDVYKKEVKGFLSRGTEDGDLEGKKQKLALESERTEGELREEEDLATHGVSDCELVHDYLNHFHQDIDSLMFAARPHVWLQAHSALTVVSNHPNLLNFLREYRLPGTRALKFAVYLPEK
jgi:hypothetical protein